MGWYKDGNWVGMGLQDLPHILADLHNAVNEREKAFGRGLATDDWTPWYEAGGGGDDLTKLLVDVNGTEKRLTSPEDFVGVAGCDNLVMENLVRLRFAMGHLAGMPSRPPFTGAALCDSDGFRSYYAGYFVDAGYSNMYTSSDLLEGTTYPGGWLGYYDPWNELYTPRDARIWIQLCEAACRLRYGRWLCWLGTPGPAGEQAVTGRFRRYFWDGDLLPHPNGVMPTPQEAWDAFNGGVGPGWGPDATQDSSYEINFVIEELGGQPFSILRDHGGRPRHYSHDPAWFPDPFTEYAQAKEDLVSPPWCTKYVQGELLTSSISTPDISSGCSVDIGASEYLTDTNNTFTTWPNVGTNTPIKFEFVAPRATLPEPNPLRATLNAANGANSNIGPCINIYTDLSSLLTYK